MGADHRRIGVVTGGGDAPGLNTVIRAVVMAAARQGWETIGILGGFEGLLPPVALRPLDAREMDGLLFRGGTVLGTSNRGRFSDRAGSNSRRRLDPDAVAAAAAAARDLDLEALICIGGDGSLRIARALAQAGVPVVGVPKTIDNDLPGTDATFGFQSAVAVAVDALDRLSSTAESLQRVMVLEVMGHHAGWIAVHAGVAGGADLILIPEIRFTWEGVCRRVEERASAGFPYTLAVVAEGARPVGGRYVMTPAGRSGETRERRLCGIGPRVATEIQRRTGRESRAVILAHLQRGGQPNAWDRQLCTRFGVAAVEAVASGAIGTMVALRGSSIVPVPLSAGVGRIRSVPVDGELVQSARAIGICFGDEPAVGSNDG
jgi:ATP-dependent phosphofructokinase / diphosphate-dependent phosphofructokinase